MNLSGIPVKFTIPWANSAGAAYINTPIPTASQIGVNNGYASLTDGWVPLNDTPIAAGGIPPRIQDMNGILNEITAWNQWQQAGGAIPYDATFQAAIGGYPKQCVIQSAAFPGVLWFSTVDANTSNPDTSGISGFPSGTGWKNLLAVNSPSLLNANGYKKYPDANSPSGYFIEQWGAVTTSATGSVPFTYPIAFPNAFLSAQCSYTYTGVGGVFIAQTNQGAATLTQIPVSCYTGAGVFAAVGVAVWVRGY